MSFYDKIIDLITFNAATTADSKKITLPKKIFYEPGGLLSGFYLTMPTPELSYTEISRHYTGICINARAKAVGQRKITAQLKGSDGKIVDLPTDHFIQELFNQPHPGQTRTAFMNEISKWLDYEGNAFVYINRGKGELPVQMWVLPANLITIKAGADLRETIYVYNGQTRREYEYQDIVHIKRFVPSEDEVSNFHYGTSPELTAALTAVNIQNYYNDYLASLFSRGGTNPIIFNLQEDVSVKTGNSPGMSRIESIREGAKGLLPDGANYGVFEGVDIVPLQSSSTRVSTSESEAQAIKTVCAAFGLGKDFVEKNKSSENGTIVTQADIAVNTIFPIIEEILSAIAEKLKPYEPNLILSFDNKIDVGPDAQLARDTFEVETGMVTKNEYRVRRGLPPTDSPDGDLTTIEIATRNAVAQNAVAQPKPDNEKPKDPNPKEEKPKIPPQKSVKYTEIEEEYKAFLWKKGDKLNQTETQNLKKDLVKYLDGLQDRTKKNITAQVNSLTKSSKAEPLGFDFTVEPFPLPKEEKRSEKETEKARTGTIGAAAGAAVSSVNGSLADIPLSQLTTTHKASSAKKITAGVTTLHNELQATLQKIVNDYKGTDKNELKNLLLSKVDARFDGVYKVSRAVNIAQTTTTATVAGTQKSVFKQLGFDVKWLSVRDAKVRDSHRELDGMSPDKEGLFHSSVSSGYGPGEMFHPADSCQCRCQLFAVTKTGKVVIGYGNDGKNFILNAIKYNKS